MRGFLQGVLWVTGVYFYFLIFAQFSFLEILEGRELAAHSLKAVMGAMAIGGIIGSSLVLPLRTMFSWIVLLRGAAVFCAAMPLLAVAGIGSSGVVFYAVVAMGIGLGLGLLTVLLAANLGRMMNHVYLGAGLGTGLAYMLSNLPWVFLANPSMQSYASAAAVISLSFFPIRPATGKSVESKATSMKNFTAGLVCFSMLVWLDSAAFYIIQHNQEIKQGTWGGGYLWRNAMVHLVVAVLSGWLLWRSRITLVLVSAFVLLGGAGLMASEEGLRSVAGYLYPAGVSLYSVALILYPAVWLGQKGATLRAVVLFAVAGWIGSAMGVGMAQDLNEVPRTFVVLAGMVMIFPALWRVIKHRKRELIVCVAVATGCLAWYQFRNKPESSNAIDSISLGREVYISEGCLHCHSCYVRPGTRDVLLWGPARSVDLVTKESPVLIGNRRQGPDLLQVGLRRSRRWMRQHFIDPSSLSPHSTMPSYAYLFEDERGEALVEFLAAFDQQDLAKRQQMIYQWAPSAATSAKSQERGHELFTNHCVCCHGEQGKGDGVLADQWLKPPANLVDGPFAFTSVDDGGLMLARVIKFGIYGTDMPGHELLSDADVKTLVEYVKILRKK
ncbi:MAG: cbb3-type cytochrome c oxidase subunit II [Verrucomicrobiae bacterium]|nr:cbb3-type cytochrome c oxidase subunit II [Verrucomicrobiae bacterium]NNJ86284.1 c-type cytochrome [Akkermansiaceae bacterium]